MPRRAPPCPAVPRRAPTHLLALLYSDASPAAAQGQRAEIDMLRGELGSLRGRDGSPRTSLPYDASSHYVTGEPPDPPSAPVPSLIWSRTSTLEGLESPAALERSSAAGELRTSSAPPRASVVRSPRMVMGESTHEMHAEL